MICECTRSCKFYLKLCLASGFTLTKSTRTVTLQDIHRRKPTLDCTTLRYVSLPWATTRDFSLEGVSKRRNAIGRIKKSYCDFQPITMNVSNQPSAVKNNVSLHTGWMNTAFYKFGSVNWSCFRGFQRETTTKLVDKRLDSVSKRKLAEKMSLRYEDFVTRFVNKIWMKTIAWKVQGTYRTLSTMRQFKIFLYLEKMQLTFFFFFLLGTRQDSTDLLAVLILLIWGTHWPTSVFECYRQAVPL